MNTTPSRRQAFTLVEIMIVVMIIGVLLTIAVPQWRLARDRARTNTCLLNLRRMEDAKDQVAMINKLSTGDPVDESDVFPVFMKGAEAPDCPAGGTYTLNAIGVHPECSIHGTLPN